MISAPCLMTADVLSVKLRASSDNSTAILTTRPPPVQVGPTEHVICALSGGVDSTVAATLVHQVLGDRLHCIFVDNGLLRYKARTSCVHLRAVIARAHFAL